jgi:ABC-type multidrug transport system ATPase subunit
VTVASLRDVAVRHGRTVALDGVTLEVEAGAIVAVVGGDGAGKTTLARTLAGVTRPTSGEVVAPPRGKVGYLPSGPGVWAELTVRENLEFIAAAFGLAGDDRARQIDALLTTTGLTDADDRLAAQLSGGMRRKLATAMVLIHRPLLAVLDEPTTGVDPVSRFQLWRLLATAAADGAAVVMTTTYLDEAERATTILVLDQGRPLVAGDLETIRSIVGGRFATSTSPGETPYSWRRASAWRTWTDDGMAPPDSSTDPDLNDLVTVLSMQQAQVGP